MSSDIRDKNMIVQSFKNKGLRGEVIALISDDADYGLTREQIAKYADKKMDIDRMRIYSECLRTVMRTVLSKLLRQTDLAKHRCRWHLNFIKKVCQKRTLRRLPKVVKRQR